MFCNAQSSENYYRFIDSAYANNDSASKNLAFLDLIPQPIEDYIPEKLGDYHLLKAFAFDDLNQDVQCFQSLALSLEYTEKEKNYSRCCYLSMMLFRLSFDVFEDTKHKPLEHLKKAKCFRNLLKKGKDRDFSDFFIQQGEAYYHFMNNDYEKSNETIYPNLDDYKSYANKNGVFNMYAMYQIALNHIGLNEINKAHKYIAKFKESKIDSTISTINYKTFKSHINLKLALYYRENTVNDSTMHYLGKIAGNVEFMNDPYIVDYYKLYADIFKEKGDVEMSKSYLDSLVAFQNKMIEYNALAGDEITSKIVNKDKEIINIKKKASIYYIIGLIIIVLILFLGLFYFIRFKKGKNRLHVLETEKSDLSYFKTNNEKLSAKVQGLEDYINGLKIELKEISKLENDSQKQRITTLYKNLRIDASTILDKGDCHYNLVNELNVDFFKQLKENHPDLNKSETIICYYVFVGFSNKEIALFLNTTIRSVESKRYRISKKLDLKSKKETLAIYLNNIFENVSI